MSTEPLEPTETTCPDWCASHERSERADVVHEQHHRSLWAQRPPINPEHWVRHLYVSTSWFDRPGLDDLDYPLVTPATMTLVENHPDAMPTTLEPDEARAFAAALIRGAEIVEATRTETCPGCQTPSSPEDLRHDGQCCTCKLAALHERRASLTVVRR